MFLRKPTPKEKSFLDMPSCINDIIDNWCKQRATVCATMHGRPYTPGTSHDGSLDSAAKAMMSSCSGQERLRRSGPSASAPGLAW